jgi:cellobiose-specific phosphotransferase system component IIC
MFESLLKECKKLYLRFRKAEKISEKRELKATKNAFIRVISFESFDQ